MYVWIWNIENCWNHFKKGSGGGRNIMVVRNQTGMQYMCIGKCQNEMPYISYILCTNKND
jgi:hypothetical protein